MARNSRPPRSPKIASPWWQSAFPWVFFGICGALLTSMLPTVLSEINPNLIPFQTQTDDLPPTAVIPLWRSSFETDFPGDEWIAGTAETFSPTGEPLPEQASQWSIISSEPSLVSSATPKPIEGERLYKGWINRPTANTLPHASYPQVMLDKNPQYLQNLGRPVVTRFYVWADWDSGQINPDQWLNLIKLDSKSRQQPIILGMRGSLNQLELLGVGDKDQFSKGDGWEVIAPTEEVFLPLRQWVQFTIYVDYLQQQLVMWLNGVPIFHANGGALKNQDASGNADYLQTLNWGLEASSTLAQGTVYNDNLQVWLAADPTGADYREPQSPYEKSSLKEFMELPPDAPPEVRELLESER